MDDDAFAAYVISNAPRYELETLERIAKGLHDNIASGRWGKPPGLDIGINVEATMFGTSFTTYGTVVRMTEKECTIESPGSAFTWRISYQKYAI